MKMGSIFAMAFLEQSREHFKIHVILYMLNTVTETIHVTQFKGKMYKEHNLARFQ